MEVTQQGLARASRPLSGLVRKSSWRPRSEVQKLGAAYSIVTQAWSPIGGITFYTLDAPVITSMATAYGKSPAQVMLRWGLQSGRSVIPKSNLLGHHRISHNEQPTPPLIWQARFVVIKRARLVHPPGWAGYRKPSN